MHLRQIISLLLLALLTNIALADSVLFSSKIQRINSSNFPRIETKLSVFSRKPVPELSRDDFSLKEDEKEVSDFQVEVDATPVFVSLVLDRSGSMSNAMNNLKKAAFDFIEKMDGKAYVQLISFASDIKKHTSFSNVPSYFKKHIARLEPFGATALYDAVAEGVTNLYDYPTDSRKVVVAFTDGNDQNAKHTGRQSKKTVKELVKLARKRGIPIYLIGLGSEVNQNLMTKMAKLTGGTYLHASDTAKLALIFRRVAKMVELGYVITYQSPKPDCDGTWRKVEVASKAAGKKDQGQGKYKAPDKPKEEPKRPEQGKMANSAMGIPLVGPPAKFIKEGLNARLIKSKHLDDHTNTLDDSEPAKNQIKAYIDWANEEIDKCCDKANQLLGPILAKCVAAIASENFIELRPLGDEACRVLKAFEEDVDAILTQHKKLVSPLKSEIQNRFMQSNFYIRFLYHDVVRLALHGQSSDLRTKFLKTDLHNNSYRMMIESYNHAVKFWQEQQKKARESQK